MFEELVRDVRRRHRGACGPGFLDKIGLGFDRLQELNPQIVMCTISGYGATGPYRDLPEPRHRLRRVGGHARSRSSTTTGSAASPTRPTSASPPVPRSARSAILAALVRAPRRPARARAWRSRSPTPPRTSTGTASRRGRATTSSPTTSVTGNPSDDYERRAPGLGGMWEGVRYQYYESSDGHILFMASEQAFWKNFCEGVDRMDLFEKWPGKTHRRPRPRQPRAAGDPARHLPDRARRRSGSTFADEHNTTIAPANTRADGARRPAVPGPVHVDRRTTSAGADSCCSRCTSRARSCRSRPMAPTVGEHTDEVLARVLGYDDDKLAQAQGHRRARLATPAARGR